MTLSLKEAGKGTTQRRAWRRADRDGATGAWERAQPLLSPGTQLCHSWQDTDAAGMAWPLAGLCRVGGLLQFQLQVLHSFQASPLEPEQWASLAPSGQFCPHGDIAGSGDTG